MKIYQLTNTTPVQMMGYVILTENGRVIVIDGGYYGQSEELYRVLKETGKEVDLWILTHLHDDHFGTIIEVLEGHNDISVKAFWRNRNDEILGYMDDESLSGVNKWYDYENRSNLVFHSPWVGEKIEVDNVCVEVLGIDNPEFTKSNIINDQSMIIKISEEDFSVIFLGDLGVMGGRKLKENQKDNLKADAVQMAHHGQDGVERDVYELINPQYAFWPTPKWLWDNTQYLGKGNPGDGPFKTPEVIGWMERLGTINITSFDKTTVFDTKTKSMV